MSRAPDPMVSAITSLAARLAEMGDHQAARQMQPEINRLRSGAAALDNVAASRSPLDTPAAHVLKVAKLARTFDREVTAGLNRASQIYRDGVADVQRRIAEKVDLKPHALAAEIRTRFVTLKTADKMNVLAKLVAENRGPELAAIVSAPELLTGLTDDQRTQFEQAITGKHAAAELDQLEMLDDVLDAVSAASRAAGSLVKGLTDPNKLATIEREAAAADAAGEAFSQSLQ